MVATAVPAVVLLVWGEPRQYRWLWLWVVTLPLAASIVIGGAGAIWFSNRSRYGLTESASAYLGVEELVLLIVGICCAFALAFVVRAGHSWSWTRPGLLVLPGAVAVGVALVATVYFQSAWNLTPAGAPAPDPDAAARTAYAQPLADWFTKINPISDRLDACKDPTCRKAALTDLLTAIGAFDGAVRRLAVPAPYQSDWLALERANNAYEVQILQGFQTTEGVANFSASAADYTAASDLARDLHIPGY